MHPNRLLAGLRAAMPPNAIVVADGGDFLSFARAGLTASTMLDPGPLGCIGIGTPFGIAAAMARAFGLDGECVERAEQLDEAIKRALAQLANGKPALLDVLVTPEAASSDAKSGLAWVPDLQLQAIGAWDEAERAWRQD
jgi:thiamine pyrophosphate-dependent acetolactate synthase large subunit-like protein